MELLHALRWLITGCRHIICSDGGELIELYKREGFGQLTLRVLPSGKCTKIHHHEYTREWWIIIQGEAIINLGVSEGEYVSGQSLKIIEVPPFLNHSIENAGAGELILLFWKDKIYDPKHPDKILVE